MGTTAKRIQTAVWATVIILSGFKLWSLRFSLNPDGLSYLEMPEKIPAGQLGASFNAYWSPGYAILTALALKVLNPITYWKPACLVLVNFCGVVAATFSFLYLLKILRGFSKTSVEQLLPSWFFYSFMAVVF